MNIPSHLLYTKEHEWIKIEGNTATVGITDFAQGELGDIIFVELPDAGQILVKEDPFGTIEAVKTVADLFAPLSGKVLDLNENLEDDPALVNSDAFVRGWLIKIEISSKEELDDLLTPDLYRKILE
ncbi:MAG: glycine cleavage system protein GcvH [Candidatus Neomarinimicrobiota bacterium]